MTLRKKIQLAALAGTSLTLSHKEVQRVYDVIGWAANHLFGLAPEISAKHDGVQRLAALDVEVA